MIYNQKKLRRRDMIREEYDKMQQANRDMFIKAIRFACEKHMNQRRKKTPWPYIVHIYEVAQILQENGADIETLVAGVLHDSVEDTDTTLEEIEENFGSVVASYVDLLSENKTLPYVERKAIQARRISSGPRGAKMIKCADCLSNLKSIFFDLKRDPNVLNTFHSSRENIQEHYRSTIEAVSSLKELKMFQELTKYYQKVFGNDKVKESTTQDQTDPKRYLRQTTLDEEQTSQNVTAYYEFQSPFEK